MAQPTNKPKSIPDFMLENVEGVKYLEGIGRRFGATLNKQSIALEFDKFRKGNDFDINPLTYTT